METNKIVPLVRVSLPIASRESVERCIRSTWLGYGPECRALEGAFTEGRKGWALATSSCTSALHIAATLCRPELGDEVILPPITFVSAAMAFAYAGFVPRFADVDGNTLMPTPESIAERITSRTRAVVAVHLYGQRASMLPLRELCDRHGLLLIEDCAHRIDLLDAEERVSDFACFSFNAMKEVPCGEGGILWGRSAEHEKGARAISNAGLDVDTLQRSASANHRDYEFSDWLGLKFRLNDILASIVRPGLELLPGDRARRHEIFDRYDRALHELTPHVVPIDRGQDDSCLMYVVRLPEGQRERIREVMAENGVASSLHYPSLSDHRRLNRIGDSCPTAERLTRRILTLPCYITLDSVEQHRAVEALTKAVS